MSSWSLWFALLIVGLGAIILAIAVSTPEMHMLASGTVTLLMAAAAVWENRKLRSAGASRTEVAARTAHYISLVWVWGALGLLITYVFFLQWKEWWQFFLAFAAVALLSLGFARALARDAAAGRDDPAMLKIGRYLSIALLAGMLITVAGLIIDGKMVRYLTPRFTDWAGNNIFFFGALALAAISANALLTSSDDATP